MRLMTLVSVTLMGLALGSASFAGSITYGDFVGANVLYSSVVEESTTDPVPLYGAPIVSLNALVFSPTSFGSSSSNGGSDITDSQLTMTITAKQGSCIDIIRVTEEGDYTLVGTGTSATSANVGASVFVTVLEINGSAITPFVISDNLIFTPSGGTYNLADDGPGIAIKWQGVLELTNLLAGRGYEGCATKVNFTMNNTLSTSSEEGTSAFIKKKSTIIDTPEPMTMLLVAFGAGVAVLRRRAR
ncbi:MAG TPA: PEP-CTERM sorting domain-containing protein [Planctomycetota bacterium]|nr:PEP-CTERM sorting domain-containing protein [Planctomycetota bacterium]